MEKREILVGFDASPAAERALRWAAVEASLRTVPLRVCHAWTWPYPQRSQDGDALRIVRGMGVLALDDGVRLARKTVPGLDVRPMLRRGAPSGVLLAASENAALIVVGARGTGGFDSLPLGSAAAQVPAHADRPVVVVPAHGGPERPKRIVVGIDGSPAGKAALRFALREARLRRAAVTMVCAWWDSGALPGPDRLPFTTPDAVKEQAKARFTSTVGPCLVDYPDVAVEERFVMERAGRVLTDSARDAMLLVVGDHGIGSSPATLLGAVTQTVLHEMPCPVAVVHARDPEAEES